FDGEVATGLPGIDPADLPATHDGVGDYVLFHGREYRHVVLEVGHEVVGNIKIRGTPLARRAERPPGTGCVRAFTRLVSDSRAVVNALGKCVRELVSQAFAQ